MKNEADFRIEPGKQQMVITRMFDAPRELIFKTITDPSLIPQWWGPSYLTTTVDEMDVRPGGRWRYVQRAPDGSEYSFHGVYHEVKAPERLVYTFEFEGAAGHVVLETITLEDAGGQTRWTDLSVFQSVDDRDAMVASGMQSGATELLDRLEQLVTAARV
jgi:uncharacterized protein YndB with AHSA1/START domain